MISTLILAGFAPDRPLDIKPDAQEAHFVACDGVYPTMRGFRREPSPVQTYEALPTRVTPADTGACYGAYVARFLDGSTKIFAGTKTAIYRGEDGAWVSYSPSGIDFDLDDEGRWRFAMFGNDCIAVCGTSDPILVTDTGTAFATLAGIPPRAKVVAVVNPGGSGAFVFLLNLSPPTGTTSDALTPTMWWCSAIGDDATWTPGTDTQSANGYLNETPGEITGAKAQGPNLLVYKQRAIYCFEYAGPPTIWNPRLVSSEAGALSQEAIIDLGDGQACMGYDDFYLVDGAGNPQPIPNELRRYLFLDNGTGRGDLDRNVQYAVWGRYDRARQVCYWHYPSIDATAGTPQACDKYVAWHRPSGRWVQGVIDVEAVVLPELPGALGFTYGDFGSLYATWGTPDMVTYDSYVFAGSSDVGQAIFKSADHALYALNGEPAADGYIEFGDWGDGQTYYFHRRQRPRFAIYPENIGTKMVNTTRVNLGSPSGTAQEAIFLDQDPGWVNFRANARFHRWKYVFPVGDAEIGEVDIDFVPMGIR